MDNPQAAIIPARLDARAVADLAISIRQSIMEIREMVLKPGVDFGKIPGTSKDVLLKPGAEKLNSGFKLYPVPKLLTCVEDWKDGFFFYRYQIDLMHRETGEIWGSGIGSCNSREKKYAWRWVTESELPAGMDKDSLLKESGMQTLTEFDFAVKKAETSGQYAKSAEHWQMFKDAIASGTAKKVMKETKRGDSVAWEITIGVARYRLPNPEICDLVNTIDKMAFKRALVAATLIATNASEFFTQDLEDFASLALPDIDVIEGVIEDVTPPAAQPAEPVKPLVADTPKQASCLSADETCQKQFAALRDELRITSDTPYLERLGVKKYSDYPGTLDELFAAMRNQHAKFLLEGDHKPIGRTPEAVIDEPGAVALATGEVTPGASPFDHSAPQVNPHTGAVETPRSGSAFKRGLNSYIDKQDTERIEATHAELDKQAAVAMSNDDIPSNVTSPHYHKRPNGAAETMLMDMPIGGD